MCDVAVSLDTALYVNLVACQKACFDVCGDMVQFLEVHLSRQYSLPMSLFVRIAVDRMEHSVAMAREV